MWSQSSANIVKCPPDNFLDPTGLCKSCTDCTDPKDCKSCESTSPSRKSSTSNLHCPENFFPDGNGGCIDCILCDYQPKTPGCHYCDVAVERSTQPSSDEGIESTSTAMVSSFTDGFFIPPPYLEPLKSQNDMIKLEQLHGSDPLEEDNGVVNTYILGAGVIATIVLSFVAICLAFNVTRGIHRQVFRARRQSTQSNTSVHFRNQRPMVQLRSFREARRDSPVHYKVPRHPSQQSQRLKQTPAYYKVYLPQSDASLSSQSSLNSKLSYEAFTSPPVNSTTAKQYCHHSQHSESRSKRPVYINMPPDHTHQQINTANITSNPLFHWETPTTKSSIVTIV
ncbi:uncharacterized protein LOC144435774 isoform X2 [Glandiceps talaboti]